MSGLPGADLIRLLEQRFGRRLVQPALVLLLVAIYVGSLALIIISVRIILAEFVLPLAIVVALALRGVLEGFIKITPIVIEILSLAISLLTFILFALLALMAAERVVAFFRRKTRVTTVDDSGPESGRSIMKENPR